MSDQPNEPTASNTGDNRQLNPGAAAGLQLLAISMPLKLFVESLGRTPDPLKWRAAFTAMLKLLEHQAWIAFPDYPGQYESVLRFLRDAIDERLKAH